MWLFSKEHKPFDVGVMYFFCLMEAWADTSGTTEEVATWLSLCKWHSGLEITTGQRTISGEIDPWIAEYVVWSFWSSKENKTLRYK